ncbi:MAG: stage V sporulation protein AE, partial [Chloroflexota bacterium]
MLAKKRVIVLTDGDLSALRATRLVCAELGLGLIDVSAGSPTSANIAEVEDAIMASPYYTVVVFADDAGHPGEGEGESMIAMLGSSP